MEELFPYQLRQSQQEIMQEISTALSRRTQFVFESGTGSGKTVCVLASALRFAFKNNKKILYTTRTTAQQQQVILE
jgi:DNA excision repair protein ERCC-2